MHQFNIDDPELVADAAAYVTELRDELEAQIGRLEAGAGKRALDLVLADPALCAYVRRWARQLRSCETKLGPILHLPEDAAYSRVRAALLGAHEVGTWPAISDAPPAAAAAVWRGGGRIPS
jgi:hypothetical protein